MAPQSQPVRVNPKTPAQIGELMRQRHYRARVWLNENEYKQFIINVEKTGLSKETYMRQLIMGYKPRELPTSELLDAIKSLMNTCNNLTNHCFKKSDYIDTAQYNYFAMILHDVLLSLDRIIN